MSTEVRVPVGSRRLAQLAAVSLQELPGIGLRGANALQALEINSVLDLLLYYPRAWADWSNMLQIDQLVAGEEGSIRANVQRVDLRRLRGRTTMVQVRVGGSGSSSLGLTFFNQSWRSKQLHAGMEVVVSGKVSEYRSKLQMANPRVVVIGERDDSPETGRIVPIYRESEKAGLSSHQLARLIERALEFADEHGAFVDPLSERRCRELDLMSRSDAFHGIHQPKSELARIRARRRLAFDELWRLQVILVMRKRAALASARGIRHEVDGDSLVARFVSGLPFALTGAQRRAIDEIANDLKSPYPMHRLLQGDVGAGKTVVALASLLYAVQGGYQGALMVPTEVLAEQHYLLARELLAALTVGDEARLGGRRLVEAELITSRTTTSERTRLRRSLEAGAIDILVGTHALLTEDIQFSKLGVVVIDEQHRFGVDQRAALREKGSLDGSSDPDLLVMTATPIPRTAAMTVYGDLDYSVVDELPNGRSAIETIWIDQAKDEHLAWDKVRAEVTRGQAAFVVCPLVRPGGGREEGDDEEDLDRAREVEEGELFPDEPLEKPSPPRNLRSATEEFARLGANELRGLRLGLLHGQLSSREKQAVMESFRAGDLDVLVATTVIEVGVDLPRATVMVICDADRFGIAQLHQLRGRVGRSDAQSYCYLLAPPSTASAESRLVALSTTADGFELAEVDLELRGEGTVLGVRQKGRNDLRLASLRRDKDLVLMARDVAMDIVEADPTLSRHPSFVEELRAFVGDEEAEYLLRS